MANSSGFVGTTADRSWWKVQVYHPKLKRNVAIGRFHDPEIAAKMYDEASCTFYPGRAPVNKIEFSLVSIKEMVDQFGAAAVSQIALAYERIKTLQTQAAEESNDLGR